MTREDLFLAIGQVESSRLARSELSVPSREIKEDKTMKARPRRIFRNLLIAAVIVSMLAVTAYAAIRGFGLKEQLTQFGMKNPQVLDPISETISDEEGYEWSTQYAGFSIEEAVLDSNTLYISAKIVPLQNDCVLVPGIAFDEDVVTADGLTLRQLKEQNRALVYADVRCNNSDGFVDGLGYTFQIGENGELYYYIMGKNTFFGKEFALPCRGITHTGTMESKESVDFEVTLTDKSTAVEGEKYLPEARAFEETGIRVNSISVSETEMGAYVTFNYDLPEGKYEYISMRLVGLNGEELPELPGANVGGAQSLGGQTFEDTRAYQKPLSVEELQLVIKDVWGEGSYGPYAIEKE